MTTKDVTWHEYMKRWQMLNKKKGKRDLFILYYMQDRYQVSSHHNMVCVHNNKQWKEMKLFLDSKRIYFKMMIIINSK